MFPLRTCFVFVRFRGLSATGEISADNFDVISALGDDGPDIDSGDR
jgi:hypothetical protein